MQVTRSWFAALYAAGVCAIAPALAEPIDRPPVQAFMRTPTFARPQLSPDGRLIAALIENKSGRLVLAVLDPVDLSKSRVVGAFADADVGRAEWVNNRRLVYSATDTARGGGDQLAPGLFAVDADGENGRQLVDRNFRGVVTGRRAASDRSLPWYTFLHGPTRARTTDDVFVVQIPWDVTRHKPGYEVPDPQLFRLDTRSAQLSPVSRGTPTGSGTWFIDAQDEPRIVVKQHEGKVRVHMRIGATDEWRELIEFPALGGDGFIPQLIREDGSVLVVARNGRDTEALFSYDPVKRRFEPDAVVAVEGFDFAGSVIVGGSRGERLLGVRLTADAPATVWIDPDLKRLQETIDRALPGRTNLLSVSDARDAPFAVVQSFSDSVPPTYYIVNVKGGQLTQIVRAFPEIEPKAMSATRFERIRARDGLSIPTYVTEPNAKEPKARPTVVLIHGGPWVRGRAFGWDAQAQFLASRGYLVLQPEFRGSLGYGYKHFQAGWRQWGLTMQDDLVDASRWAIEQGLADPKRICVVGASYGGYAAMMALARDGDMFRCGVSLAGVTDIELMFTANWTDVTESGRRYSYAPLIGDPVRDAQALRSVSPMNNAEKIKQPVLLAHGGSDLRVPIEHGRRFRAALAQNNNDVEWVVYGDEGHGLTKLESRVDFWQRVEKFLDRHIGPGSR